MDTVKLLSPSVYAFKATGNRSGNPDLTRPYHWAQTTVRRILSNQEYAGERIKELDNIIRCLYEDRVCGRLTSERYDSMANGYEQEQAELRQKLKSITESIDQMDMREKCIQEFMDKAKSYIEMPKLTPELLRVFIRRIEVYEKPEKYSRTCGNPIVIHYVFQLPEQNGMPAIEKVMLPIKRTA